MVAAPDLVAAVSVRVVETEMARRIPDWDGRSVAVPPGLPPLTMLADRAYSRDVLERRLRFLRLMGWYPDPPPVVVPGTAPVLPDQATVEDHLAVIYGAAGVSAADPAIAALSSALRDGPPGPEETRALTAFFDQQADAVDPGWRGRWPHDPAAASAFARGEAANLHGDRLFGRRRAGRLWTAISDVVWRLAEQKRRRWG